MIFYICEDRDGAAFDCVKTFNEAVTLVQADGGGRVQRLEIAVTGESIMRILGNIGGYAQGIKIYEIEIFDGLRIKPLTL